jgi:hypothetical protein
MAKADSPAWSAPAPQAGEWDGKNQSHHCALQKPDKRRKWDPQPPGKSSSVLFSCKNKSHTGSTSGSELAPRSFQVCHALLQTPPTPRSGQNVFLKLNIKKEHPDELEQCVYTAFFFARNTGPLAA